MTASPGNRFRPWDVVLVPFPYREQAAVVRIRPAVVVSGARLSQATRMDYVAMVTNAEHRPWDGDVPVSDLKLAGVIRGYLARAESTER